MAEDFARMLLAEMVKQKLNASPSAVTFAKILIEYHAKQEVHIRDLQQTANKAYNKAIELEKEVAELKAHG